MVALLSLVVPIAFGALVAWLVYRALPPPRSLLTSVLYWLALSVVATIAARGFERSVTRTLPLGALLRLSLLLDDERLARALRRSGPDEVGDVPPEVREHVVRLLGRVCAHSREATVRGRRLGALVDLLAAETGLAAEDRVRLVWAARALPLRADGAPSVSTAAELGPVAPWLGEYVVAIDQHEEWWDGSGHPGGLAGTAINLGARLLAVATTYDQLIRGENPLTDEEARQRLTELSGSRLDPAAVRTFLALPVRRVRLAIGPLATASLGANAALIERLAPLATRLAPATAVGVGVLVAPGLTGTDTAPDPGGHQPAVVANPEEPRHEPTTPDTLGVVPRIPQQADPSRASDTVDGGDVEVLGVQITAPQPPAAEPPVSESPASDPPTPQPPGSEVSDPEPGPVIETPTPPTSQPPPEASDEQPEVPPPGTQPPPASDPVGLPLIIDLVAPVDGSTWQVVVTNGSDAPVTGVRVILTPPAGHQVNGRTGPTAAELVLRDVGTIEPGQSVTLTYEAATTPHPGSSHRPGAAGPKALVATARADGVEPVHAAAGGSEVG